MTEFKDSISIQVGLSGYSFKIETDSQTHAFSWMSAENIFATPQFQKDYDDVQISVFTPKCTLVPCAFYSQDKSRDLLADVVRLEEDDVIQSVSVPEYDAVMLFTHGKGSSLASVVSETVKVKGGFRQKPLPELYYMLKFLNTISEYNKIVASYKDGYLYLSIAQGHSLMLCNSYQAQDFTTAEYYIFLALKKLQLNPEMSSIYFRTELDEEQKMSLYRYFHCVEVI